ncbi:hypothetical protein DFR50_14418 [Roseiarcus fermentans]|uniref:Uncharacterized protein n=1 Tax=Roseiarcus fermentans TaxID=1473586 RepID=A0A366EM00_9HYPH|nr:hypothetical protein DFR50_14418 [Roseiarcus fermentans]
MAPRGDPYGENGDPTAVVTIALERLPRKLFFNDGEESSERLGGESRRLWKGSLSSRTFVQTPMSVCKMEYLASV